MCHKNFNNFIKRSGLLMTLLLPGCWNPFTSKDNKGDVSSNNTHHKADDKKSGPILCSINGKPAIYEEDFINSINQMIQGSPYLRGASVEALPSKLKRQILDKLTDHELILAQAYANKVTETEAFKKEYKEMMHLVEKTIIMRHFERELYDKTNVSEEAIVQHFNENKERYVKVAGGILASGAKFDSDAHATKFLQSLKDSTNDFDKKAKEAKNAKFKHFGRVSKAQQGFDPEGMPEQVRTKILETTTFPSLEKVVVSKDNVWVIAAIDKQNPVYFELSEIKPQIERMIKDGSFNDTMANKLKEFRATMSVNINEDYFKDSAQQAEQETKDEATQEEASNRNAVTAA